MISFPINLASGTSASAVETDHDADGSQNPPPKSFESTLKALNEVSGEVELKVSEAESETPTELGIFVPAISDAVSFSQILTADQKLEVAANNSATGEELNLLTNANIKTIGSDGREPKTVTLPVIFEPGVEAEETAAPSATPIDELTSTLPPEGQLPLEQTEALATVNESPSKLISDDQSLLVQDQTESLVTTDESPNQLIPDDQLPSTQDQTEALVTNDNSPNKLISDDQLPVQQTDALTTINESSSPLISDDQPPLDQDQTEALVTVDESPNQSIPDDQLPPGQTAEFTTSSESSNTSFSDDQLPLEQTAELPNPLQAVTEKDQSETENLIEPTVVREPALTDAATEIESGEPVQQSGSPAIESSESEVKQSEPDTKQSLPVTDARPRDEQSDDAESDSNTSNSESNENTDTISNLKLEQGQQNPTQSNLHFVEPNTSVPEQTESIKELPGRSDSANTGVSSSALPGGNALNNTLPTAQDTTAQISSLSNKGSPTQFASAAASTQVAQALQRNFTSFKDEPKQSISLELHPPELGQLRIIVEQSSDHMIAQIIATEFNSTELLLKEKDFLLEALSELGLGETSLDISHGGSNQDQGDAEPENNMPRKYKAAATANEIKPIVNSNTTGVNFIA